MLNKLCLIFILFAITLHAEENSELDFFVDAIAFRSDKFQDNDPKVGMVDIYVVVPNQMLSFDVKGNYYLAECTLYISISDSAGNDIYSERYTKQKVEQDFNATQSANGEFLKHVERVYLNEGDYKVKVTASTVKPRRSTTYSRNIKIIDYSRYPFSMSGLMLLSSVEEIDGKFKITPHSNDNINKIKDGFFTFFETYARDTSGEVKFVYELWKDEEKIQQGEIRKENINKEVQRHFLYIKIDSLGLVGELKLKVNVLNKNANSEYTSADIIASGERTLSIKPTFLNRLIGDIDMAIRQMRYVATFEDLSNMKNAESQDKKIELFIAFWEGKDPSPDTERNEALEEYFTRVKFASDNFRSMNDGWLSDRGMVYIILGPPLNTFRQNQGAGGRVLERWVYRNNRQFLFEDRSGFGEFRLIDPPTLNEIYRYGNIQ